jgi:AraC-like DNA-binding protein
MINLQLFKTVEELYNRKGKPTGELIIDAVIEAICSTKTHRSEDIALWLNVDKRDLWHSIHMLTGMRLNDIILQWRVLQAKEKWDEKQARYNEHKELVKAKKKEAPEGYQLTEKFKKAYRDEISVPSLDEIAKRYGWDSYRSLQRVAKRFGVTFKTLRYAPRKQK